MLASHVPRSWAAVPFVPTAPVPREQEPPLLLLVGPQRRWSASRSPPPAVGACGRGTKDGQHACVVSFLLRGSWWGRQHPRPHRARCCFELPLGRNRAAKARPKGPSPSSRSGRLLPPPRAPARPTRSACGATADRASLRPTPPALRCPLTAVRRGDEAAPKRKGTDQRNLRREAKQGRAEGREGNSGRGRRGRRRRGEGTVRHPLPSSPRCPCVVAWWWCPCVRVLWRRGRVLGSSSAGAASLCRYGAVAAP
jgi:hypothetical protein